MRYTRMRKFRKKGKKLALLAQIAAIWYLAFIGISYLTTDTKANFNDIEVIENTLGVCPDFEGTDENCEPIDGEWDKSSLSFTGISGTCDRVEAILKNGDDSGNAIGPIPYEILWAEKGNAWDGEIVFEGEIDSLAAGETTKITFDPEKSGKYRIIAYQHSKHPGSGRTSTDIEIKNCEVSTQNIDKTNSEKVESSETKTEKETQSTGNTEVENSEYTEVKEGQQSDENTDSTSSESNEGTTDNSNDNNTSNSNENSEDTGTDN